MLHDKENVYSFTLALNTGSSDAESIVNSIYEHCDDVSIHASCGFVYADFDREGGSLESAITSAIDDIEKLTSNVKVVSIGPSVFVNLTEIATRINKEKETVRRYISGARLSGGFPPPVAMFESKSPLWRWSDVAKWLHINGVLSESGLHDAEILDRVYHAISCNEVAHSNGSNNARRCLAN